MPTTNGRLKEPQDLLPHPEQFPQETLAHGAYVRVFEALGDVEQEREAAAEARFVVLLWEAEEGREVRVHFGHEADVVDGVAVLEGAAEGGGGVDVEEGEVGGCHGFAGGYRRRFSSVYGWGSERDELLSRDGFQGVTAKAKSVNDEKDRGTLHKRCTL